jgi:hypothetical protein
VAAKPPNDLQASLSALAVQLPTIGADIGAHIKRLTDVPDVAPTHATVADASAAILGHVQAFLGEL